MNYRERREQYEEDNILFFILFLFYFLLLITKIQESSQTYRKSDIYKNQ